jgi:hypothetical protein
MSINVAVFDESNKVINIILCNDDYIIKDNEVIYTNENPAYIGGDYVDGYFYPKKPFTSWTRNNGEWIPPTPIPTDGKRYSWDEENLAWQEIVVE